MCVMSFERCPLLILGFQRELITDTSAIISAVHRDITSAHTIFPASRIRLGTPAPLFLAVIATR